MGLLEPTRVPGLDRALLELFAIFGFLIGSVVVITISSIVGVIRAVRRRRRGASSSTAVVLAAAGTTITGCWLIYWVGHSVYHKSNPLDALLAINFAVFVMPFFWLVAAIRANATPRQNSK